MENKSRISALVPKRNRSFAVVAENFLEQLINDQRNQSACLNANRVSNREFFKYNDNKFKMKLQIFKIKPKSA